MTPRYVAIQQNWTVSEVLAHLRLENHKRDAMNQLYVTDSKGRLVDFVRLRDLIVVPPQSSVLEVLENQRIFLRATDDQETAVASFKKYDVTMLPVVDSNEVLVGVVTVDDVLDVAEKEATEDIQRLGGVQALDAPYLKTSVIAMVKKRAPWLAILFVGEMLTSRDHAKLWRRSSKDRGAFIFHAADVPFVWRQQRLPGHVAHHPRDGGGRCFIESDWWRVFRRELAGGFFLGFILAVIGAIRVVLWQWFHFWDYGSHYSAFALVIGVSLVGVVLWGSLVGAMLPFILRVVKHDPAVFSPPFVATLVDVTGAGDLFQRSPLAAAAFIVCIIAAVRLDAVLPAA